MARSTARKRALNTLYEADEKGQDIPSLLAERIAEPGAQTPLPDYAIQIVRGVADEQAGIDRALEAHSTKWPLKRMAVVDRNILRIAAWEILFNDDVPERVAIDEALGLAKSLSDDDSPAFIHGLLSALCDDKDTVLADIKAAHEAEAKEKAEREAEERRLNSPTAPGFLPSRGISGKGDGVPFETETEPDAAQDEEPESKASKEPDINDSSSKESDNNESSMEENTDSVPAVTVADEDGSSGETVVSSGANVDNDTDSSGKTDEVSAPETPNVSDADDGETDSSSSNDDVPIQSDSAGEGQALPPDGDNNSIIV